MKSSTSLILKQLTTAAFLSTVTIAVFTYSAHAAPRHHRPLIDSSGNRVGHFICGLTQRRYFGLPPKFNLALNWATLPHVAPQPGAVVVQTRKGHALGGGRGGHVSRIVELTNDPRFAIVTDEKGTYRRDIKKNLVAYVRPH